MKMTGFDALEFELGREGGVRLQTGMIVTLCSSLTCFLQLDKKDGCFVFPMSVPLTGALGLCCLFSRGGGYK